MNHASPAPGSRLWLASRSPRRQRMLAEAGIDAIARPASVDDGFLQRPLATPPHWWVVSLAHFKAEAVARDLRAESPGRGGVVLGADTVCVVDGRVVGQPSDADAARVMIQDIVDREHDVVTGVAIVDLIDGHRTLIVDRSQVRCGPITAGDIDAYVAGDAWRGKAGGYNLEERIAAGWPLTCEGDPTTVVGLPMQRLESVLAPFRRPRHGGSAA
ncbi:MAG: Maf family protein [Phycisphaerales bacterium]